MDSIIVTVTNAEKTFLYDIEIPKTAAADKLKKDIIDVLNGYDQRLNLNSRTAEIFCNRLGRRLLPRETAEEAGLWEGDYITIL